ncbi:hypothetical protein [Pseudarthrobacter sp. DSP2-3-2b1]|uniref:hypothetical protein n=1 Tax=Pseudarthrobacter sp. DSP2-3-2b1 TaxID=2804661 RepID=UPI003CE6A36B
MAGVELGSAFISVGLGTSTLGGDIKKLFNDSGSDAEAAGGVVGKKFSTGVGSMLKSAMIPALAAGGGLLAFGKNVGDLAAVAEQNAGAVGSVFKGMSGEVAAFAASSATNLGISSSEYNSFASLIGSQFKNAGVPMEELAGKTNELVTKGADLASMFGGTTSDAVSALSSALKGEMDPLEAYGISLNEAAIKGKMAEMGTTGLTGAAEQAAKTQAILALVNQQSADATGNFGREATTAAGAQQIANAQWENARATLGEALLPVMAQMSGALSGVAGWVKENTGLVTGLAIGVGGLAVAVILANAASSAFAAVSAVVKGAVMAWAGVQWLLNAAMMANPIVLVVGLIAGLVAAVVLAYNKVGWFKDGVDSGFRVVSEAARNMAKWVGDAIGNVIGFFTSLPGKIQGALSGAGSWLTSVGRNIVQGLIDGAKGMIDNAVRAIKDVGGAMLDGIKGFLGIHSPSRVFKTQVGMMIGSGLIAGIDASKQGVNSSINGLVTVPTVPAFGANSYSASLTAAGNTPAPVNVYIGNEQLDTRMYRVADSAIGSADSRSRYMRAGR